MCRDEKFELADMTAPVGTRQLGIRMIAHQLNNSLLPILTIGSLLADSLQEAETTRDIEIMVASAMKARDLVKLLLVEANRLEAGNGAPS